MRVTEPAQPIARPELIAELGLPAATDRLIGIVGRLWPQKRVKDLLWAGELLKTARDGCHLLIIGDGPQRWRLERYCDQLRMNDRAHFLGERPDVARLMPHFDVLWLGSGYEGQSNAIMEAMAAGVPVVATDIPGNRDLVVPEDTGYLVPVGDRAEFSRRTTWLFDDEPLRRRMGAAGRERILQHFTVEQMTARHAELYRQLLR
jgi:glycosyltransferase involved in cell wall biosynthesis